MSKFERAFAEVKLYIPMDSDVWSDFKESKAYQGLLQSGLVMLHQQKGDAHASK